MRTGTREAPFAAFEDAYRSRLLGTATLIHLDPERARRLVDAVLARVYADWPRLDDPYGFALRAVVRPASVGVTLPAQGVTPAAGRVELVDVGPRPVVDPTNLVAELATLPEEQRLILVLTHFTRVPVRDVAALLEHGLDDVVAEERAGRAALQARRPRRLSAELAAAVDPECRPDAGSSSQHRGRTLIRRRHRKGWALAAAALLVIGVGVRQLTPTTSEPVAAPAAPATPTPRPPCDVAAPRCRADLTSAWRTEMAKVVSAHLDPQGSYFTGLGYSYNDSYVSEGYFDGRPGALGLDLYRMRDGATEVYLQIATDREHAIRCGQLTGRPCESVRFMDGNRFTLSDPWDVAHGLEAQHRPEGTYVITIVARNTSKASRELPVTRGDLVQLIADPRLRLPPR